MTGMEMALKMALKALGVEIDGEKLAQSIEQLRAGVPEFAQRAEAKLASIDGRLERIEAALEIRAGAVAVMGGKANGAGAGSTAA
jgi:hypothetical protein